MRIESNRRATLIDNVVYEHRNPGRSGATVVMRTPIGLDASFWPVNGNVVLSGSLSFVELLERDNGALIDSQSSNGQAFLRELQNLYEEVADSELS